MHYINVSDNQFCLYVEELYGFCMLIKLSLSYNIYLWLLQNLLVLCYGFSQGKKIKCSASQAKHRLFIGNIPRNWTEDDLKKAVLEVGPGVTSVDLMKARYFSDQNYGYFSFKKFHYAFIELFVVFMANFLFEMIYKILN